LKVFGERFVQPGKKYKLGEFLICSRGDDKT
jgi:hypothetical protein